MGIFGKIGFILAKPGEFFEDLRWEEQSIKSAFLYVLVLGLFFQAIGVYIDFQFAKRTLLSALIAHAVGYIALILSYFLFAGLLHLLVLLFRGEGTYTNSYQAYAYSATPHLLFGWTLWIALASKIQWIGFVVRLIDVYSLVLLIVALQKSQKLSIGRAMLTGVILAVIMLPLAYFAGM